MGFSPATKKSSKARVALIGPAGSGKTYSALAIASTLSTRVGVLDTERGSASKYSDLFPFLVLEPEDFSPATYIQGIVDAYRAEVGCLVIDSLSHAWMGKGGALEMADNATKRAGNTFSAWREVTPVHNRLVDTILRAPMHVIVTMRSKTEWVIEENERGKKVPRKVGMAPIQRDGLEYEFDVVGDMTLDHDWVISKSRCPTFDGAIINRPGAEFAKQLLQWLEPKGANDPIA